ncbi:MAG: glutamate-5-semialdehyde dehydrogenase [Rhodospirillales bacterium]|nr:glutamate-5-semialdehyde dehydrogenase [Rhodospirillales bacterium]
MLPVAEETIETLEEQMHGLGRSARTAADHLATTDGGQRNAALLAAAKALRAREAELLAANSEDVAVGKARGLSAVLVDRLALTPERVETMAKGLEEIAAQPDPVGRELARWTRPNGLDIARVAVPLGVIGIIYESRPNVTADAGGLCLKSGNAAILRGGSESRRSSAAILACLQEGLRAAGLLEGAIQVVPTYDRAAVGHLLRLHESVDVIVPRGGKGLIQRVMEESRVPVLAHLEGNNHLYLHTSADLEKSRKVVLNAKMRRVSVCGAAETLLADRSLAESHLNPILTDLLEAGCAVRGDAEVQALDPRVDAAVAADWDTEYLAPIIAVHIVEGMDEALAHIARHGSGHTDAILAEDLEAQERFFREVDSAILLSNASTQYADGGEFGMGAEIGIATGRLHARGPVGAAELTTTKYLVRGDGQVRP